MTLPHNLGHNIWEDTFRAAASINPYRCVCLDSTDAGWVAGGSPDKLKGPIKHPNATSFQNAIENVIGVATGPISSLTTKNVIDPILTGFVVNVRLIGSAPVQCDTTVASTNILFGDRVSASETAGQDGCIKKASYSTNILAAQEHMVGVSFSRVAVNGAYAIVLIRPLEG